MDVIVAATVVQWILMPEFQCPELLLPKDLRLSTKVCVVLIFIIIIIIMFNRFISATAFFNCRLGGFEFFFFFFGERFVWVCHFILFFFHFYDVNGCDHWFTQSNLLLII